MKYNQDYNRTNKQTDMIYGEINTDKIDANSVCMGHLFGQRPTTYGEYTGVPPVTFTTPASKLTDWYIKGASAGVGDNTDNLINPLIIENGKGIDTSGNIIDYPVRIATVLPINITGIASTVLTYYSPLGAVNFIYAVFNSGILVRRVSGKVSGALIDTSSGNELYLCWYFSSPISVSDISNVMLNSGSTALPYEPYGYKIPVICGGTTTNIYIDTPLTESDTITQSQTAIQIPTTPGINTLSIDTTVQPSEIYIKYKE